LTYTFTYKTACIYITEVPVQLGEDKQGVLWPDWSTYARKRGNVRRIQRNIR